MRALRELALLPVRAYKRLVSPALPKRCKYHPSCSTYAVEAVRSYIGASSLHYLSLEGLQAATRRPESELCRACLTREYPTAVPLESAKRRFEHAEV